MNCAHTHMGQVSQLAIGQKAHSAALKCGFFVHNAQAPMVD
jgi:hypothetical protein